MNLGEIQLDFNYYKRNSLNIRFFSKCLINAKCKNILIIPQNQIKKVLTVSCNLKETQTLA